MDVQPLTTTQELWKPISELQEDHVQAIRDLTTAVVHGSSVDMQQAFQAICLIEDQQHRAHLAVLLYQVEKAKRHG